MILRQVRRVAAMMRIGLSEAIAYRAEFIVWIFTTTMPLVMLALWTAVARDAPVGRFGTDAFLAYYLAVFVVRTMTGSWVVWQMNHEIRTGSLSLRLLKPIEPMVAYAAEQFASVPLRIGIALPVVIAMIVWTDAQYLPVPAAAVFVPFALLGAWLVTFQAMFILGTLGLFVEKSIALFEVWLGLFSVLSGYLIPLELMPGWVRAIATYLPFRWTLGFPVELMTGLLDPAAAARGLALQWCWVGGLFVLGRLIWRAGVRRFEAVGA